MNSRLLSLDVLRGMTIAGMIVVNNGAGGTCFTPLEHAEWNGLTPCDLVFPFFLFMVGVSIAFALGKYSPASEEELAKQPALRKIMVRTLKMFLIGVLLNASGQLLKGIPLYETLATLRIWGILQRIALCYCLASLLTLWVQPRHFWKIIISLLVLYGIVLLQGNGYVKGEENIICLIDRALFGQAHLYTKSPIDPEGLLGVIPSVAHTLIGVIVGFRIKEKDDLPLRLTRLFTLATLLALSGYLLSFGLPLNKRIWSPSYVLVTCGMATALLSTLIVFIDMNQRKAWTPPFQWFGMNAIVLFVASVLLAQVIKVWHLPTLLFDTYSRCGLPPEWASLAYALTFLGVLTLLAYVLYRNKIFIKL